MKTFENLNYPGMPRMNKVLKFSQPILVSTNTKENKTPTLFTQLHGQFVAHVCLHSFSKTVHVIKLFNSFLPFKTYGSMISKYLTWCTQNHSFTVFSIKLTLQDFGNN